MYHFSINQFKQSGKQSGVALILVLWVMVLLTVIAASFALSARTEGVQAKMVFDTTKARYLAEAGLHRAVYELRNPDIEFRWKADGRTYKMDFADAEIEISITDETGKIDINLASDELLVGLFAVIYLFDTVELIRRASKRGDIPISLILQMGLLKLPEVGQTIFPFAVLFSAMYTFWQLTRQYELIVVRASGFSVWQFLLPIS
ncbi:MAG: LptF/LptG family permease, partial [Proteobacteria bacterium]|nr:LptF/LptG family permease [Pseudomonadota bacterium]